MKAKKRLYVSLLAVGIAVLLTASPARLSAQQSTRGISIGDNDLGGVVTSANGPEAGVWVIAETTDLPTKIRQDRGHRRSRALPHPRSSESQLQRVGARIRAGRLAQGADRARKDRST